MLNFRYWFFTKPSGPGHDHDADRVAALDVAVVVDFDAARRRREPETCRQRGEQPRLRGRLGEFAAERLAGIGLGVLDEFALLAALRHARFRSCGRS